MEKFKVFILKNRIIQISKDEIRNYRNYWETDLYNIYIDEKLYTDSVFKFYTELEFEKILNAKQLCLKKFKTEIS